METFDVVIGYNFFNVLFEFRRCEICSSDHFPGIVSLNNHFQKDTELSLYWKTREKDKNITFHQSVSKMLQMNQLQNGYRIVLTLVVFSRKQAFYDYIYFVVTVKITNSNINFAMVDYLIVNQMNWDWIGFHSDKQLLSCGKCDNNKTDIESGK